MKGEDQGLEDHPQEQDQAPNIAPHQNPRRKRPRTFVEDLAPTPTPSLTVLAHKHLADE